MSSEDTLARVFTCMGANYLELCQKQVENLPRVKFVQDDNKSFKSLSKVSQKSLKSLSKVSQKSLKSLQCSEDAKIKSDSLNEWVSDNVTYWAVLES